MNDRPALQHLRSHLLLAESGLLLAAQDRRDRPRGRTSLLKRHWALHDLIDPSRGHLGVVLSGAKLAHRWSLFDSTPCHAPKTQRSMAWALGSRARHGAVMSWPLRRLG